MCFVPVDFACAERVVGKANRRHTLEFSPAAFAVRFSQARNLPNLTADGDSLDVSDVTDNLELHMGEL
jgi:hypothetical protein